VNHPRANPSCRQDYVTCAINVDAVQILAASESNCMDNGLGGNLFKQPHNLLGFTNI